MGAGGRADAGVSSYPAIAVTPLASSQQATEEMWGGRGLLSERGALKRLPDIFDFAPMDDL
jgi:hypothetical protein